MADQVDRLVKGGTIDLIFKGGIKVVRVANY
jgi:hypothetical protein